MFLKKNIIILFVIILNMGFGGLSASAETTRFPLVPGSPVTTKNWITVAKAADYVVSGKVEDVHSYYGKTPFGTIIFSDITVVVDQVLKGDPLNYLTFTTMGGTVGELSLSVSSLYPIKTGMRFLFLTAQNQDHKQELFGTNFGTLPLDKDNHVGILDVELKELQKALGGEDFK